MKRIIFSVMAIAMAIGLTTGAAFALFSSTATVSGVTFSTGNATLQVWDNVSSWTQDYNPSNFLFQNMYPNYTTFQTFSLKNTSNSNITMKLNAKLRNGVTQLPAGAWNVLKDVVLVQLSDSVGTVLKSWETLADWNSTGYDFDTGLAQDENRWYRFEVMVDPAAGNEISDNSLSGIKFDFLGTQE